MTRSSSLRRVIQDEVHDRLDKLESTLEKIALKLDFVVDTLSESSKNKSKKIEYEERAVLKEKRRPEYDFKSAFEAFESPREFKRKSSSRSDGFDGEMFGDPKNRLRMKLLTTDAYNPKK